MAGRAPGDHPDRHGGVAGQLGRGRREASGILDFHRVSPLTPAELTLGFFFGAPIREYVLFACTLPFAALCLAFGVPSVHGFVAAHDLPGRDRLVFSRPGAPERADHEGSATARGAVGVVVFFVLFLFNAMRMGRFIPSSRCSTRTAV